MKKILLIEDDVYTRDVFEEILTDAGFGVETAVDGAEGVTRAQEGGFDLILLDVMMPKLDGLGVLKSFKENPAKKTNGPVVLLTNLGHDPVIREALNLGVKSYIIKSDINPDQLVSKVKQFLGEEKG